MDVPGVVRAAVVERAVDAAAERVLPADLRRGPPPPPRRLRLSPRHQRRLAQASLIRSLLIGPPIG